MTKCNQHIDLKICSNCKKGKQKTEFHCKVKSKAGQIIYQSSCKICTNEKRCERYRKNKKNHKNKTSSNTFEVKVVLAEKTLSKAEIEKIMKDYIDAVFCSKLD